MGGRLLGEACHFVDTCSAIVGHQPDTVTTVTSGRSELLLDQDAGHAAAFWAGLGRHEIAPDECLCGLLCGVDRVDDLYATALATAPGMNLCFHHDSATKSTRRGPSLGGSQRHLALRHGKPVAGE